MCGDEADLQGWNQSGMPSLSDSDTGTRMIKGPSDAVGASFPSRGRLATRCFKPTIYTDSWFVEPAIYPPKISNTGPTTGDGFHPESSVGPSYARRMEGGVAGLR